MYYAFLIIHFLSLLSIVKWVSWNIIIRVPWRFMVLGLTSPTKYTNLLTIGKMCKSFNKE